MGNYEFTIALRIRHPNIAPAEVTRNLGIEPLHAWRAGDPRRDGAFTIFYLQADRVRGALTVGRSDDLQAARRLIADGTDLGGRTDLLGDLSSNLETIS